MKKLILFLAILTMLLVVSACGKNADLPSLPNPPTTQPKVETCTEGHTFTNDAPVCDDCGIDYFNTTLEFTLTATRDSYIVSGLGTCTRTVINIPATHKGKPVVELASTAFNAVTNPKCEKITEVTLPDSIVKVNSNAFFKCIGLTKVTFNEGIVEMGSDVLRGCSTLETVTLPASMTYVPTGFLQYCYSIKQVNILGQITSVESQAFYDCYGLESIVLPNSVTSIGALAFSGCSALKNITMSSNIASVGRQVFDGCVSLEYNIHDGIAYLGNEATPYVLLLKIVNTEQTDFVIHDDTTVLAYNAFSNATVTSLTIGKNLASIAYATLDELSDLEYIYVSEGNPTYHVAGNCLIETANKKLIRGTKNSVIPSDGSVIEIGSNSFKNLKGLTGIVIPAPIQKLGGSAFSGCVDLEYAVLPNTLTAVELSIFAYCTKMTTVYFDGTPSQWSSIRNIIPVEMGGGGMSFGDNHILLNATSYTYSETMPTTPGNFWHYVDGKPTAWELPKDEFDN